jgi:GAF domain-containing protein
VEHAQAATGARMVALVRFDPTRKEGRMVAQAGLRTQFMQRALRIAQRLTPGFDPFRLRVMVGANPLLEEAYRTGTPVGGPFEQIAAGTMDPRMVGLAGPIAGVHYSYVHPLTLRHRVSGSLSFHFGAECSEQQRRVCDAFARQAALTLENARLVAQTEQLAATLAELGAATDTTAALRALVLGARRLLDGDQTMARLFGNGKQTAHAQVILRRDGAVDVVASPAPPPQGSHSAALAAGGPATIVEDFLKLDPAVYPHWEDVSRRGVRSAVNVPIDAGGRRIGSLHVDHQEAKYFGPADLALAQALAARAGATMERAQAEESRLAAERERARLDGALLVARTVTHDLNNALAPVVGFAELLGADPVVAASPQLAVYAQRLMDAGLDAAEKVTRLGRIVRLQETESGLGGGQPVLDMERSTRKATSSYPVTPSN